MKRISLTLLIGLVLGLLLTACAAPAPDTAAAPRQADPDPEVVVYRAPT